MSDKYEKVAALMVWARRDFANLTHVELAKRLRWHPVMVQQAEETGRVHIENLELWLSACGVAFNADTL